MATDRWKVDLKKCGNWLYYEWPFFFIIFWLSVTNLLGWWHYWYLVLYSMVPLALMWGVYRWRSEQRVRKKVESEYAFTLTTWKKLTINPPDELKNPKFGNEN